ncbi:hypothetical protein HK405_000256, partial [Cladochytrium tenue]
MAPPANPHHHLLTTAPASAASSSSGSSVSSSNDASATRFYGAVGADADSLYILPADVTEKNRLNLQ